MSIIESTILNYLLNSVWQLPLLFAAAWIVARLLRPLGPLAEHRVWVGALLLELLLPACPASALSGLRPLLPWPGHPVTPHSSVTTRLGEGGTALHLPSTLLHGVTALYAAVVLFCLARFLWRSLRLRTLRHHASPLVLTGYAHIIWNRCGTHFNAHHVDLATSPHLSGPVTLGVRRPLILLPAAILPTLPAADLETILAHEFAHIHRHDFLKNLLGTALSLPLSIHPLLWLTRNRITETRELVCDQLAATLTGEVRYAQSLLRLASRIVTGGSLPASHAIGILDANAFERRLMRLTDHPRGLHGTRRILTLAACATLTLVTCTSALALRVGVGAPSAQSEGTSSGKNVKISSAVMAGNLLTRINPTYPQAARDAKIQGAVVLHAVIGKDGTIEALDVVSGPEELRRSALDAVHQWTYTPYRLNGENVDVETTITVNYNLEP